MFGRNKETAADRTLVVPEADSQDSGRPLGKGTPTPKRKAQEAARKRPLVPTDRKAARSTARDAQRVERARTRRALDTGEERYLPVRDKGPQKRFVRDYVDARWNVGEFLIIAAFVFVLITFIPIPDLSFYILIAFWLMFVAVFIDGFLLHRKLKSVLTAKFGFIERGAPWYGVTRSAQLRRLRLPKPMVKRGQGPDVP